MKHFFSKIFCLQKNIMLIFLLSLKCSEQFLPSLLSDLNCSNNDKNKLLLQKCEILEPANVPIKT